MASSILNSDDGVISGVAGIKATGGDDGVLVFQSKGTETAQINTDKQIVAAAGTASLPVLTTTGDLNTGIYFPAADTIGFVEGGAEAMRIDSDGDLIVGGTSTTAKFAVANNTNDGTSNSKQYAVFGAATTYLNSDATNIWGVGLGELQIQNGTSARPAMLSLGGSLATGEGLGVINFFRSGNTANYRSRAQIASTVTNTGTADQHGGILRFSTADDGATNPSIRMTISQNGNLSLFGQASGAGTSTLKYAHATSGLVTFDTSSRFVKENIEDSPYGLAEIMRLQPRKYFRIDDQKDEIGFVADEVQDVLPEFVPLCAKSVITRNPEDTEIIPSAVSYDRITAVLTKAIQELKAELDEAKTRIAALEAQPTSSGE
jgi:hypothetical protein